MKHSLIVLVMVIISAQYCYTADNYDTSYNVECLKNAKNDNQAVLCQNNSDTCYNTLAKEKMPWSYLSRSCSNVSDLCFQLALESDDGKVNHPFTTRSLCEKIADECIDKATEMDWSDESSQIYGAIKYCGNK